MTSEISDRAARIRVVMTDDPYDGYVIAVDGHEVGLAVGWEKANVVRAWLIDAMEDIEQLPTSRVGPAEGGVE